MSIECLREDFKVKKGVNQKCATLVENKGAGNFFDNLFSSVPCLFKIVIRLCSTLLCGI